MKNISQQELDNTPNSSPFFLRKEWFEALAELVFHKKTNITVPLSADKNLAYFALPQQESSKKHLHSLTNYYSPLFGISDTTLDTSPSISVLQEQRETFQSFDSINLLPLNKKQADEWISAFQKIGFKGFIYLHSSNWYEKNIKDLDDYWQRRPSQIKNTLKRKQTALQKDPNFKIAIYHTGNLHVLQKALIDYHHVYYNSWKKNEAYPAFIDSIAKTAWAKKELRIGVIYHNDIPVAANMWFINTYTAYIFKLAYVESYAKYSVGTVLMAEMLKHVIEQDSVNTIDFLTGNDSYKKDWMSYQEPLYGVYLCNTTTVRGTCILLYQNTLNVLKKMNITKVATALKEK